MLPIRSFILTSCMLSVSFGDSSMPIYERYSKKRNEKVTLAKFNLSFKENEVELYKRFCQLYSEDVLSLFIKNAMQKAIDRKDFFEYTLFDDSDDFMSVRSLTRKE